MDQADAERFATEWYEAWNSHDLERILAHWADDAVFSSPVAHQLTGTGTVEGKEALRAYWAKGLEAHPDLKFTPRALLVGQDSIALSYVNHKGQEVAEVLILDADHVAHRGIAHYGPLP